MKNFLLIIVITIITSCSPLKNYSTTGFTAKGHVIYYNEKEIAKLSNIEYSLDNNKLVKEMTFKLKNQENADKVKNLIKFIHQTHKGWEIEIDFPISDSIIFDN